MILFHTAETARKPGPGNDTVGLTTTLILAPSLAEAEIAALTESYLTWPLAEGWADHLVIVRKVDTRLFGQFHRSYFDDLSEAMRKFKAVHREDAMLTVTFGNADFSWGEITWKDGVLVTRSTFATIQEATEIVLGLTA